MPIFEGRVTKVQTHINGRGTEGIITSETGLESPFSEPDATLREGAHVRYIARQPTGRVVEILDTIQA